MTQTGSATSFHLVSEYASSRFLELAVQSATPRTDGPRTETRYDVIQSVYRIRQLSLKLSPHYHPWVRDLTQRLLRSSVRGLMASDTEYRTPVAATTTARATLLTKREVSIAVGDRIDILDGTVVTLADGTTVRLAGRHVVTVSAAAGDAEQRIDLPIAAELTIPTSASITRQDGTIATLIEPMTVTLVHQGPVPAQFTDFFDHHYQPNPDMVSTPHPVDDIDFSIDGGYAVYNWELFFHIPLTLAIHLSRNGHHQDAMSWFHYVFNPTDDSAHLAPERYWKVKPFQSTDIEQIESILVALSANPSSQEQTVNAINAWRANPFRPHLVARYRPSAYMYKTVMAYLDNLIAWGDSLFRQDTGEAIDEALQLYILASNVLGPRPQPVPASATTPSQSYNQLRRDLDPFSNALREVEGALLFDTTPRSDITSAEQMIVLEGIGKTLYFGVPRNDKLLGYWNTVTDRLFKIRNSLNIEGTFRRLALFEPPIDPAMLARAAAAGISPGDAMNAANQLSPLRFTPLLRQAIELAQNVTSLGQNLLSALEKEDGETLTLLRAKHERNTAQLATQVRYAQVQEAKKSKEATAASINSALLRYTYYERLLGRDAASIAIPQLDEIDLTTLAKQALNSTEPALPGRDVPIDIADNVIAEASGHHLSRHEAEELNKLSDARSVQDVVKIAQLAGQGAALLPNFGVDFHFWGMGGNMQFGGSHLSNAARFIAEWAAMDSERLTYEAGISAKIGSYARREQEWAQQSNTALAEIAQLHKQLRSAQLREAIAQTELTNHIAQIAQLAEMDLFLNAEGKSGSNRKVTNKALYTWNKREVRSLYNKAYKLAFEVATRAQATLRHELGDNTISLISAGHMSGKEGLLAGERLQFELKQLEDHYLRNKKRELEVVRHVSLAQLNPLALLQLRTTGACQFEIPEEWYDLEAPSHYYRRIQTVAVTIPCITGPHTSINCRLTLHKSTLRTTADIDAADSVTPTTGVNAIVVSSAQQDSGTTEARDDLWRPFELYGAASEWSLELPGQGAGSIRTFDYDTISDVILTIRFTAKEDGNLRSKTVARIKQLMTGADGAALANVRFFSLRHDFPTQWAQLQNSPGDTAKVTLTFEKKMFPYWIGPTDGEPKVAQMDFYEAPGVAQDTLAAPIASVTNLNHSLGIAWESPALPKGSELWMLCTWRI